MKKNVVFLMLFAMISFGSFANNSPKMELLNDKPVVENTTVDVNCSSGSVTNSSGEVIGEYIACSYDGRLVITIIFCP